MQITHTNLLGLIITSAILIAIPGPSVLFFLGQVLINGKNSAFRSVIGNALGMIIVAILLAVGIGALITRFEWILLVIHILGAVVLLCIGLSYIRTSSEISRQGLIQQDSQQAKLHRPFLSGILVALSNPKTYIMFSTIVPSFVTHNQIFPIRILLLYSCIPILIGLLIDSLWVLIAHVLSSRAFFQKAGLQHVYRIGGGLIILMATALVVESFST